MRAVAGVDDAGFQPVGQEARGSGRTVAQDNDVRPQRLKVQRGVLEGFAFLQAGGPDGEVDHVGTEAQGGQFERREGAGAGFDEEIDEGFATEGGDFFQTALAHAFEGAGGLEDVADFGGAQFVQAEQVFAGPGVHEASGFTTLTLSGTVSRFSNRTRIFSSRVVGKFLPT